MRRPALKRKNTRMNRKTTKTLRTVYTTFLIGFFIFFFIGFQLPLEKHFGAGVYAVGIPLLLLLFFIGFGLLFLLNYIVESREESERARDLQTLATQFGWRFTKSTKLPLLKEFAANLGMSGGVLAEGETSNFLDGFFQNRSFAVFDQQYVSGSGKNRRVVKLTLALLEVREANFPIFCLETENFMSKLLDHFEQYDIDFPSHPRFSQKYTLYGRGKDRIRQFFTPRLLDFYERIPLITTVAGGKFILVYGERRLEPREIVPQLNFMINLANLFLRR